MMRCFLSRICNWSIVFAFISGAVFQFLLMRMNRQVFAPSPEAKHTFYGNFQDLHDGHHLDETILAEYLHKKVRLFFIILTNLEDEKKKAIHVKATWAKRVNGYTFVGNKEDPVLPAIAGVKNEGRDTLWNKTRAGLIYAFQHHLNDYDFFMKTDDDAFVIPENLRYILSERDPDVPIIMGRRFKPHVAQGYGSGGAGYVLSRAALKNVVNGILGHKAGCVYSEGAEDVNLGLCAQMTNVTMVDSLDEHGIESFHPFTPAYMIDEKAINGTAWFSSYNFHNITTGLNCCSDHTVSFHYITPSDMYAMEFLIYHLYPYGINRDVASYKKATRFSEELKQRKALLKKQALPQD